MCEIVINSSGLNFIIGFAQVRGRVSILVTFERCATPRRCVTALSTFLTSFNDFKNSCAQ